MKADNTTTFSEARRQLLDFAADNGIGHLTAASGKGAHHNTYQLESLGRDRVGSGHDTNADGPTASSITRAPADFTQLWLLMVANTSP